MTMYYWGKNFGATIVLIAISNLPTIIMIDIRLVSGFLLSSLVLSFAFFIAGKLSSCYNSDNQYIFIKHTF